MVGLSGRDLMADIYFELVQSFKYQALCKSYHLLSSTQTGMATIFSSSSSSMSPHLHAFGDQIKFHPSHFSIDRQRAIKLRCDMKNPSNNSSTSTQESEPENLLLKMAWYGSELLGIAASFVRSPKNIGDSQERTVLAVDGSGVIDRNKIVESIKDDFLRSYFVTGNLTLDAYEEDCEFADPAGSFRGLRRFKRNCTNFGSLLERSNMKLMKWEEFEEKAIGHWRFSCVLSFPWKPILSATGYTEYYFNEQSGRVCRHVEYWNVPKMVLLKQILKPSRGLTK